MSVDDLTQRYGNTWVKYNGYARSCLGFSMGELGEPPLFIHFNDREEHEKVPFLWQKLDVSRPKSGWYTVLLGKNLYPVWFTKLIIRQWSRGISGRNCKLWYPRVPAVKQNINSCLRQIVDAGRPGPAVPVLKGTPGMLDWTLKQMAKGGFCILSPSLAAVSNEGEWNGRGFLYLRDIVIGRICQNQGIRLEDPMFTTEIKEIMFDAKVAVAPERMEMKPSPSDLRVLVDDFFRGGGLREAAVEIVDAHFDEHADEHEPGWQVQEEPPR